MPGASKTGFPLKFKFSHCYSHCKTPPPPSLISIRTGKDIKDEKKKLVSYVILCDLMFYSSLENLHKF